MKRLLKRIITIMMVLAVLMPIGAQTAMAQFSVLPQAVNPTQCTVLLTQNNEDQLNAMLKDNSVPGRSEVMGCAIMTGRISLNMIPYFISYFANFLLSLVGLISVLFIVVGGYFYIWGGLTENKEKGKKTIYHALLGMAVAILAWSFITVVISAVTS